MNEGADEAILDGGFDAPHLHQIQSSQGTSFLGFARSTGAVCKPWIASDTDWCTSWSEVNIMVGLGRSFSGELRNLVICRHRGLCEWVLMRWHERGTRVSESRTVRAVGDRPTPFVTTSIGGQPSDPWSGLA